MKPKTNLFLSGSIIAFLLLALCYFYFEMQKSYSRASLSTIALVDIKGLVVALYDHAEHHGNRFPRLLTEVSTVIPPKSKHFTDPDSKRLYDWLYYGGYTTHSDPPLIIAASPTTFGDKHLRVVGYSDSSARALVDREFQIILSKQILSQ